MESGIDKKFWEKKENLRIIILLISVFGVCLRLFQYFYNRSLWMDEVYLSSSFLHFNYTELATKALDHDQKAPLGFLWLVKLSVDLFGKNEMALRLIPLISGILSIGLFARICRHYLNPLPQILALAIFSFAPAIIYHSVEIKQYATECLATLVALCLFIRYQAAEKWKDKLIWGILGAITVWFSYSVIFVMAGIAGGMSLYDLLKKNWKSFFPNLVPFLIWMISFGINYLLFTHRQAESDWVVYFFKTYDNFMPFPPHSVAQLKWFPRNLQAMMDYPLGLAWNLQGFYSGALFRILSIPVLPVLLLAAGIRYLFKTEKKNFYSFILPVILMLVASGLYLYPLIERFWIFVAPILILFIAFGFDYFRHKIKSGSIVFILFFLVLIAPVAQSVYYLVQPQKFYKHKKSFERESLSYINSNFKPGDAVYNYWNNHPGFEVYKVMRPFKFKAVEGRDFRKTAADLADYNQNLAKDFKRFAGAKRVWLIFNTQFLTDIGDYADDPRWYYKDQVSPVQNLILQFNKIGKPVHHRIYPDVSVYLFELY